jgi:hypothetical protein
MDPKTGASSLKTFQEESANSAVNDGTITSTQTSAENVGPMQRITLS